jgi:uncharacterized membrane protein YeaQ/YmgE (transglycosylase-associated protein family)
MDFITGLLASPLICLGWIIVGIIAGALARQLVGSKNSPWWMDLLLGLAGAFIGGIIAGLLGLDMRPDGGIGLVLFNLVVATLGAILLIWLGRLFTRGSRSSLT